MLWHCILHHMLDEGQFTLGPKVQSPSISLAMSLALAPTIRALKESLDQTRIEIQALAQGPNIFGKNSQIAYFNNFLQLQNWDPKHSLVINGV